MNKSGQLLRVCDSSMEDLKAVKRLTRWCFFLEAKVNARDQFECTPLILAALRNHTEICRYLVRKGADVNDCSRSRQSALLSATYNGNLEIVDILLENGADVNHVDAEGNSALIECFRSRSKSDNRLQISKLLLKNGADVNQVNKKGESALLLAYVKSNLSECAELLIGAGANVRICGEYGRTPIWKASVWDNIEMCRLLLDKGADINSLDSEGNSPLLEAVRCGATASVPFLVERGANIRIINKTGKSILAIAAECGNEKNMEYLTCLFSKTDGLSGITDNQAFDEKRSLERFLLVLKNLSFTNVEVKEEIKGTCLSCSGKGSTLKDGYYANNPTSDIYGSCDDNYETCLSCGGSGKGKLYRVRSSS